MKITDIRTAEIKGHGYSTYVRIYTDEGLIGNGECIHGGEGCPALVHALKQLHHRRETRSTSTCSSRRCAAASSSTGRWPARRSRR